MQSQENPPADEDEDENEEEEEEEDDDDDGDNSVIEKELQRALEDTQKIESLMEELDSFYNEAVGISRLSCVAHKV